jgi:hypothetical protein
MRVLPGAGKTCNKYDTTCRGNFLTWAKAKFVDEEEKTDGIPCEDIGLQPQD